jgi:RHS repeat-associated protein
MPTSHRETVLCRYRYDPLDRQDTCTPYEQANIQRFYCKSRLATEIQDTVRHCIFQYDDHLLAQQQSQGAIFNTTLMATDHQRSILNAHDGNRPDPVAYTPYGHRTSENGLLSLLGFNGERRDSLTGHYHLGNGYRQFNPVLMRFNSPDRWSPFKEGGLNAYAYCEGDPRNRVDPTGHAPVPKVGAHINKTLGGVSKKSKAISRPLAASDGLTEGASSSSQVMSKQQLRRLKRSENSRRNYHKNKNLLGVIKDNEALQPNQGHYNVSDDLRDLDLSNQAYETAKSSYGFKRLPDPNQPHYWTDPQGNTLLDVAHFDATISHFRNMAIRRVSSSSYVAVYRLEISRAQYIQNFTPIDLMAIRR